jgi:hypothetical protein
MLMFKNLYLRFYGQILEKSSKILAQKSNSVEILEALSPI